MDVVIDIQRNGLFNNKNLVFISFKKFNTNEIRSDKQDRIQRLVWYRYKIIIEGLQMFLFYMSIFLRKGLFFYTVSRYLSMLMIQTKTGAKTDFV